MICLNIAFIPHVQRPQMEGGAEGSRSLGGVSLSLVLRGHL